MLAADTVARRRDGVVQADAPGLAGVVGWENVEPARLQLKCPI
jgi:hypothetical protein